MSSPVPNLSPIPLDLQRFFKAVADDTRLTILRLLSLTDLRSGELVSRLGLPANAVSYHLKQLRIAGLLRDRRSHADARDVYYSVDLARLRDLYTEIGETLQVVSQPPSAVAARPADPPPRVLFLCTHNSARSQLAEAVLRQRGGASVEAYSAGNEPTALHPMASALFREHHIDAGSHVAKSMDGFLTDHFDYIVTVCDRTRDHCPVFPGDPIQVHWSFPDPAAIEDEMARQAAFRTIWEDLVVRVDHLLSLPHPARSRPVSQSGPSSGV